MSEPWMYVVLIGLVFIVLATLLPKQEEGKGSVSPKMLKELEETMDGFLTELEEDNKQLLQTIVQLKQDQEAAQLKLAERVEDLEKENREQAHELKRFALLRADLQETLAKLKAAPAVAQESTLVASKEAVVKPEGSEEQLAQGATETGPSMKERYAELFQLHESGKSVEYIAKALGLNKGEVHLIIQLAKQEAR